MHLFSHSSLAILQDRDGNIVKDRDDKPRIHTDGTGFISEDLALLCPSSLYRGEQMRDANIEVCKIWICFLIRFTFIPHTAV